MQEQHKADVSSNIVLQLRYRPPFDWHSWLEFVATRAIPGCELVIGDSYIRTLSVGGEVGWLKLSALDDRVEVSISASLQGQVGKLLPKLRHFLDLDACPETISKHLGSMYLPGLRVPGCLDGFEIGVRAILGQQVSVAAARTMAARITEAKGQALETPWPNLGRLFPTPETLSDYDFPGLPKKRAQTIRDLSNLVQKGLDLSPAGDWDETRQALLNTTGIGPWTAGYITMRCMQNPDAFPTGDLVLCQRLGMKPKELEAHSQIWRPWRAYAAISIWKASPCTKAST